MMTALSCIIAYLLGSISPSIVIGKLSGVDIKKEGSGNAGATNTLRVLGKKAALITLAVDIGKGVLAVYIANSMGGATAQYLACAFVVIGHIFPIWFKFKGGKGVAVAFGAIIGVNPMIAFGCLTVVVLTVFLTRIVSLGSILATLSAPIWAVFLEPRFIPYIIGPTILVIFMHRSNIKRLLQGQENKL